MKKKDIHVSCRRFLKTTGALAATASLPPWAAARCATPREQRPVAVAANERIHIGLIGYGGQGRGDARRAESLGGKVVAVCDVDAERVAQAKKIFADAQGYADFRKLLARNDLDAIVCGTVDHWHTLISMASMKAGKDIYCEKPLTLTIDEGKRLVKVQRQTKRILQTGTQQRSSNEFRTACDLVRNGRIGTVKWVEVWLPAGLREGPFKTSPIPEGFDYDFWLGQTPNVPYVKERTHFSFRYWWEYSGGHFIPERALRGVHILESRG